MKVERKLQTTSKESPQTLHIKKIGKNLFEATLHENVIPVDVENENGKELHFKSELSIITCKCLNIDELKGNLVRLKYNENEEMALINKGIVSFNDDDYQNYRDFVAMVKHQANIFWSTI